MSTLQDVARQAGLSVATVSEILRGKAGYQEATRQRVEAAAHALRYRPSSAARQLRGGRSHLLGVLIGLDDPQVNFGRLASLEREAWGRGYRVVVGQVRESDPGLAEYLEDFSNRGLDGLFWLHQPFRAKQQVPVSALCAELPVVALDHALRKGGACVRVDYGEGVGRAVGHLAARGCKRIALVLAGAGEPGDPLQQRVAGYRKGLARTRLRFDAALLWVGAMQEEPLGIDIDRAMEQVTAARADAVVASNDVWAAAMLRWLRLRGRRVPHDLAVVGFDNLPFASLLDPALTTLDQRHDDFAVLAMNAMVQLLAGKKTRVQTLAPELVVRESA